MQDRGHLLSLSRPLLSTIAGLLGVRHAEDLQPGSDRYSADLTVGPGHATLLAAALHLVCDIV